MACPHCGGNNIEYDSGQGNAICTNCGSVLEENTIIAEISFSEGSGGAASVVGTFVGAGQTGARTLGPGRRQTSKESREKTMEAARRRIGNMAIALKLNEHHAEAAQRLFQIAIAGNFIQGRRSDHVVACCLYIVCRLEKTTHMLIDFSELLQLNVFKLGVTFLHLARHLSIKLPVVDPSLYISRFATLLDFGEDTQRVANDALRLVARMDRDWIRAGRRPAGICGACLLIAARMHHYRRSQMEIIQVVKIGEGTLRKRLDEFAQTESGRLTVADFRALWLEDAADPPAFAKSRKRHHWEFDDEEEEDEINQEIIRRGNRQSKVDLRQVREDGGDEVEESNVEIEAPDGERKAAAAAGEKEAEGDEEAEVEEEAPEEEEEEEAVVEEEDESVEKDLQAALETQLIQEEEARLDEEDKIRAAIPYEAFEDVDDDEIDNIILNEDEVKIKTQVWMEFNKEYLQEQEEKRVRIEMEKAQGIYQNKKGRKKAKRNNTIAAHNSAAEAGRNIIQPKLPRQKSKKINYSVLDNMDDIFDTKPTLYDRGSPAPMKSVFEEPGMVKTPTASRSRQSSMPPSREGSARPGRLSSVSRMIKSKGGATKFSGTPGGSRAVSREQSIQRTFGSGLGAATPGQRESSVVVDLEDDEVIAPPKSRTRAEREAAAMPAAADEAEANGEGVGEYDGEFEEEENESQPWQAQFGYKQVEEEDEENDFWE